MDRVFVTAINCMDGRVQIPVIEYIESKHGVDFVDVVTEPGPNKILAESKDKTMIELIKSKVEISVKCRKSKLIAIVGHHDCAGNPAGKETQITQIRSAVKTVESWGFDARNIGLWVDKNWRVYEVQ